MLYEKKIECTNCKSLESKMGGGFANLFGTQKCSYCNMEIDFDREELCVTREQEFCEKLLELKYEYNDIFKKWFPNFEEKYTIYIGMLMGGAPKNCFMEDK